MGSDINAAFWPQLGFLRKINFFSRFCQKNNPKTGIRKKSEGVFGQPPSAKPGKPPIAGWTR